MAIVLQVQLQPQKGTFIAEALAEILKSQHVTQFTTDGYTRYSIYYRSLCSPLYSNFSKWLSLLNLLLNVLQAMAIVLNVQLQPCKHEWANLSPRHWKRFSKISSIAMFSSKFRSELTFENLL